MKSRQFLIKLILVAVCIPFIGVSQILQIGDGSKDTIRHVHLTFESNKGDSILYYQGYSVVYSYTYNLPRYVFHLLTVDQLTIDSTRIKVNRSNSYRPVTLPNGSLSATQRDYYKSGYDRGHMVPAGDFVWNKELKDETFFYTNINPQKAVLNRGIWMNLENKIRGKVLEYYENAYIVTGAIFNSKCEERIGPDSLCVPDAYFKILYFESKKSMFAFLFDHTVNQYMGEITDFQVTVDEIEQITGENFFDLLDDDLEAKLESVIVKFND
jgi:endonuclease G